MNTKRKGYIGEAPVNIAFGVWCVLLFLESSLGWSIDTYGWSHPVSEKSSLSYIAKHPSDITRQGSSSEGCERPASRKVAALVHQSLKERSLPLLHQLSSVSWVRAREAANLAFLTVWGPLSRCLEAARLAAKRQDLRIVSTGGKIEVLSAIGVLRGVATSRRRRSHATNTKSEDVSLQTDCLRSSAIG